MLSISAQVTPMLPEGYAPVYAEYREGNYERAFTLSDQVDSEHIEAIFKDGVLRLTFPKARVSGKEDRSQICLKEDQDESEGYDSLETAREGPVQRKAGERGSCTAIRPRSRLRGFLAQFGLPMPAGLGYRLADLDTPAPRRSRNAKEVEVLAELPGMDDQDVDISVAEGTFTIRGEKKAERRRKKRICPARAQLRTIERVVPLPEGLDLDSANATFKNGVLTVSIPRTAKSLATVRHIPVKQGNLVCRYGSNG